MKLILFLGATFVPSINNELTFLAPRNLNVPFKFLTWSPNKYQPFGAPWVATIMTLSLSINPLDAPFVTYLYVNDLSATQIESMKFLSAPE
nr:hypothetical protein [Mycoplasmopsis bovis]